MTSSGPVYLDMEWSLAASEWALSMFGHKLDAGVVEMVEMRHAGLTYRAIGDYHGVSAGVVSRILSKAAGTLRARSVFLLGGWDDPFGPLAKHGVAAVLVAIDRLLDGEVR